MTKTSHIESKVIAGPIEDIPSAMFVCTSSCVFDFKAYCANAQALDKSTNNRKNGNASLSIEIGLND